MPLKPLLHDWGYGDPDAPGYAERHIKPFTAAGITLTVHVGLVPVFRHLVEEMSGWGIDLAKGIRDDWGYANVSVEGHGPENKSWHSVGGAIDLDATRNPAGSKTTTFPIRKTLALCDDLGLTWGRTWESRPEPMHFEVAHPLPVMLVIAERLRREDADRPPFRRVLSQGDTGDAVRWCQERLTRLGYFDGPLNSRYTFEMQRAVRRWQGASDMKVTGTITAAGYDALRG